MKKLIFMFTLILVFGLSACVEDTPVERDRTPDDNQNETQDPAPSNIVSLIEEDITGSFTYTVLSGPTGTEIKAHYVGMNEDVVEVHAFRMEYEGRWSKIDYLIIVDPDTDTIVSVKIISHDENWGSFIELNSFLDQFEGKSVSYYLSNDVVLGVDGDAAATTTILGFNRTLEEAMTYYQNNVE